MSYNFTQDLSTEKWDIKIDPDAKYGYFERNRDGAGGGLWFGTVDAEDAGEGLSDVPTQLALIDYDGVPVLPQSIVKALRDAGYYLDEHYDPDPT